MTEHRRGGSHAGHVTAWIWFRLIRQKKTRARALQLTRAGQATGKIPALWGADDYWASGRLAAQVAFLEAAPANCCCLCSRGYYVFWKWSCQAWSCRTRAPSKEDVGFDRLCSGNHILAISVMIRASVMEELGIWPEVCNQDWDMWLRITDRYEMAFYRTPLPITADTGITIQMDW